MRKIKERKETFIINNKDCLCPHVHLNPMTSRLGKYFPTTDYNHKEKILNDDWNRNKIYNPNKSKANPSLTNHEVTDNLFCETCLNSLYI